MRQREPNYYNHSTEYGPNFQPQYNNPSDYGPNFPPQYNHPPEYGFDYPQQPSNHPSSYGANFPTQHYNPYEQPSMKNNPLPNEPAPPPSPFEQYAKPPQPQNWPPFMQQNPNFYPEEQSQNMPQQSPNNLIAYFQDQNGQMDVGKMLSTVSQVANTVQQVTPVIQQINSVIKSFR